MLNKLFESIPVPNNPATYALAETLAIFLIVLIVGFLINLINTGITGSLSAVIGAVPAFIIRNYLTYPGTIHHELAHALLVVLTGARLIRINLVPKGTTLGSVEFEPRGNLFTKALQLSLSAIAPVVLGSVSLFLLWSFAIPNLHEIWQFILFWYIFASILFHMTMSGADYMNFFKGFIPSFIVIFLVFLILGAFGIAF